MCKHLFSGLFCWMMFLAAGCEPPVKIEQPLRSPKAGA